MFWAQGGDFFEYEEKLNLSFGYPAVVALNYGKKKYSIFRSSFSAKNLENYIKSTILF
jgi:protein disulfide-isomerase A6